MAARCRGRFIAPHHVIDIVSDDKTAMAAPYIGEEETDVILHRMIVQRDRRLLIEGIERFIGPVKHDDVAGLIKDEFADIGNGFIIGNIEKAITRVKRGVLRQHGDGRRVEMAAFEGQVLGFLPAPSRTPRGRAYKLVGAGVFTGIDRIHEGYSCCIS